MAWQTPGTGDLSGTFARDVLHQEAQTRFMAGVYRWMFLALALTGGTALYVASNESLLMLVARSQWVFVLLTLGVGFALAGFATRLSRGVAAALFLAYATLVGATFSVLFLVYRLGSIGEAFLLTGGIFFAMSLYGTVTKKDLTSWGSFLMMGLIGVIIAGVVNLFLKSDMLGFIKACMTVVVFTGLTAYDTQKLRALAVEAGPGAAASSLAVVGAFSLYLDFINLFLALLRLFGDRRRD
jgi:uncharacterized protein